MKILFVLGGCAMAVTLLGLACVAGLCLATTIYELKEEGF